jgi:hypothetical protein
MKDTTQAERRTSPWIEAMTWSWAGWMGWCMPTAAAQLWAGRPLTGEHGRR